MPPPSSSREQRRRTLGIDSIDHVVWKSWEPGSDYVRRITIKNIDSRAQVITCQLAQRKTVFLTPFPEPITLRSGMSYDLEICFKPIEQVELHDRIVVEVQGRGTFDIHLECLTPFAKLRAPASHDFGVCPVYGTSQHEMTVQNAGTVPMCFYWDAPLPFTMTPVRGTLEPGESMTITASFSPDEARVVVAQAVCRMTDIDEVVATVALSGVGRFPYTRLVYTPSENVTAAHAAGAASAEPVISARRTALGAGAPILLRPHDPAVTAGLPAASNSGLLSFGRVAAGTTVSAQFTVENPSPVPATITVERVDDALVCPFTVTPIATTRAKLAVGPSSDNTILTSPAPAIAAPSSGDVPTQVIVVIPSGGSQTFKVTCKAGSLPAGLALRNEFHVQTAAASPLRVEVTGTIAGARLRTSTTAVDFGDVDLDALAQSGDGSALTQTVSLRNVGDASAVFNVLGVSPGAAFTVEPASGVVPAKGQALLHVTFCPSFTMNYLRRLYIVVEGGAEALFLDVFGTAYNRTERALPFGLRDIEAYHLRMNRGLGCLGPAELTALATHSSQHDAAATSAEDETLLQAWRTIENELGGRTAMGDGSFLEKRSNRIDYDTVVSDVFFFSTVGGSARAMGRSPYAVECKSPLVFGALHDVNIGSSGSAAVANVVSVLNISNCPARASWCVPADSPLCVVPEQHEVPPGESVQFQIRLKNPDAVLAQSVLAQTLECFVHPASTASFRLVEREGFVPPTCFTVPCHIHRGTSATGVSAGSGHSLIRAPSRVVFKPCAVNHCGYVAAALENTSDVPLTFQLATVSMLQVSELVADDLGALLTMRDGTARALTVIEANAQFPPDGLRRAAAVRAASRGTFGCFPSQGVLPPRSTTLVLLHFLPPDLARYDAKAVFTVNQNERDMLHIPLRAEATLPRLRLAAISGTPCVGSSESRLLVPPTCLTGEAAIPVAMVNPTSLPVAYQVQPSEELLSAVRCEPAYGVVQPGERIDAVVYFSPEEARVYEGMISYVLRTASSTGGAQDSVVELEEEEDAVDPAIAAAVALAMPTGPVSAITAREGLSLQGSLGGTAASTMDGTAPASPAAASPVALREYVLSLPFKSEGVPARVEMEPTVVACRVDEMVMKSGELHPTIPITLFNSGLCAVRYEVGILVVRAGDEETDSVEWPSSTTRTTALTPQYHAGYLPARSHATVLLTVDARAVHGLCEYVVYTLVAGIGTHTSQVASPKTVVEAMRLPHCKVTLRGLRPALQITDVRSLTQQRSLLWRQLSINDINASLAAAVEPADRLAQDSYAFPEYIAGLQPIPVDLGVGEPDMVPFIASVLLENVGDCPSSFEVWLPMDSEAHEETWFVADAALRDMLTIVENATIEITPRRGTVPVGGSVVLTITYRFQTAGVHTLPVLLRVHDGRRVLLVLEGRTLPSDVNAIAFHHGAAYSLLPVALGELEPPMQGIVVENPYDRPVEYRVHTEALGRLAEANCGFPILQCVNPSGVLAPRSVVQLMWYFRPLEAKTYVMDVPIDIVGGESYVLTFTAAGYHPRRTQPEDIQSAIANHFLRLPRLPRLSLFPALPVLLSQDVYTLGAVPYFSLHRRTLWIENHHPTHTFSFLWDTRHAGGDHVLRIEPESGVLEAGGSRVACKVTFYAGSTSQVLEWPATCMITNETKLSESEAMMAAQHQQQHQSQGSATAVGKEADAIDAPLDDTTKVSAPRRRRQPVAAPTLKTMGVRALTREVEQARRRQRAVETQVRFPGAATRRSADGELTLTCDCLNGTATGRDVGAAGWGAADLADMEEAAVVWNALELLFQARVMPIEDYESCYGSEALAKHYLPPLVRHEAPRDPHAIAAARLQHRQRLDALWAPDADPSTVAELMREGMQVTRSVVDEMLRALVSDPHVTKAMVEPFVPEHITYQDLLRACADMRQEQETAQASSVPRKEKMQAPVLARGSTMNAVEDALDMVIFDALKTAMSRSPRESTMA